MSFSNKNFTLTIINRWGKPVTERHLRLRDVQSVLALLGRRHKETVTDKDMMRTKYR